nr:hypothetical protein CFP56_15178 [Quercus suber]
MKNLNKFLGQYGHGINHLDSFKIWEVDAAKNELETQKERSATSLPLRRRRLGKAVVSFKPLTSSKELPFIVV